MPSGNGMNQSFDKKLTKAEKMVLKGQKVFFALAQARVISFHLVTLDWVSIVFDKNSIVKSSFWCDCGQQYDSLSVCLSGDPFPSSDTLEDIRIVRGLVGKLSQITGFEVGEIRPGRNYYKTSWLLINDNGEEVGCVSGGGHSQKNTFNLVLRGAGCTFAKQGWNKHLYNFTKSLDGRLARVDLALDCLDGEGGGVEAVREAYKAGGFNYNGRSPTSKLDGSWDQGHSRTYSVAFRGSKSFTAYEKGHQYGLMDSKWWRAEIRFGNQDRILDLELLIEPEKFFAGAYPFAASLLESVSKNATVPRVIKAKKKLEDATAAAAVERKMKWFANTVAPSIVHLTKAYDVGMHGFMWLCDLAVVHADRPLPRSLRKIPTSQLTQAMRNCLSPTSPEPAGLMPS